MTAQSSRHLVDPELAPMLELFPTTELTPASLIEARARGIELPIDPEADKAVSVDRRTIKGPAGDLDVFCLRPVSATGPLPCILHVHGGGYVMGSAETMAPLRKPMVQALGCAFASVEYRLAPETAAPGAVEDCYAALAWLKAEPGAAGVDPARIGVMGESAGGGLAAALALLARDRGEHQLTFQHLIYPMLDDRTSVEADPDPFAGEFIWPHANNLFGWGALLGVAPGSDGVSHYASPARAESVAGLPPTFVSTGALDLFVHENIDYARRLIRAGVPTELHVYPGAFHAFDFVPGADVASRARRDSLEALRRALR
jgi:acetyl esterase/lipase